jgi:hypothetical protein
VLDAEIEFSALTADKLLRAPVFKGIRAKRNSRRSAEFAETAPQGANSNDRRQKPARKPLRK